MAEYPLTDAEARGRDYLAEHWLSPEAYITSKFKTYDIVLLSENHAIRHNLLLCQRLIPMLHAAGVTSFGMEFGASEDQPTLDALVGFSAPAETYDEDEARRLMFNYNTGWAYREYMDIYRAAWAFNRSRPPGARPFRVLNLSYRYDWSESVPVRTPENTKRVFPQSGTEQYRAALIGREILDKGEKLLVLTGSVHAFTRFAVPEFDFNAEGFVRFDDRYMGHLLYQRAPDRVFVIQLHQPFDDKNAGSMRRVLPAGGAVDRIMAGFEDRRVGFDLVTPEGSTPLGDLPDDSFYASGRTDFRLRDLADGYVYETPFDKCEGCTVDEAFMTEANWPEARRNFPDPHWHRRPETPDEYWRHVRDYVDIKKRYAGLGLADEAWRFEKGDVE